MAIFDLFTSSSYTFLELKSKTGGLDILAEYPTTGIVKMRDGKTQTDNMEQRLATSTVYIKPDESFVAALGANLVGHGIRVAKDAYNEAVYRIESQSEGYDFDLGTVEFYKVTLTPTSIWETSDLPLE